MERGPRLDRRGPEGRLPYSKRDDDRAQGEAGKADPAQGEPGERDGEQWGVFARSASTEGGRNAFYRRRRRNKDFVSRRMAAGERQGEVRMLG